MELYNVGLTFFYRQDNKPCNAQYAQFGCQCVQRCALFDQPGGYNGGACPLSVTQSPTTQSPTTQSPTTSSPTFTWCVVVPRVRALAHAHKRRRTASTARR